MTSRGRIVDAGAELFGRQGFHGTAMKQIVEEARAPFGSVYHFFPGGKDELGEHVIRSSGEGYRLLFITILDAAPNLIAGIGEFFAGAAAVLEQTDYADACPIATIALEVASVNEQLRMATADVFESWIGAAVERFAAAGIPETRARSLAIEVIAVLEGAFLLSRAFRSTEPMIAARASAVTATREAMPAS